jgi:hypothetical protein
LRVYIPSNHATLQSRRNPILELGGAQRGDASARRMSDGGVRAVSGRRSQRLPLQFARQASGQFRLLCLHPETVVEGVAQQPARRSVILPSALSD